MRYSALSIGPLVARTFSGRIHSTFERTANFVTGTGGLGTLTRRGVPDLPAGIRVDVTAPFSFARTLRAGQTIACRAGIVRVAGTDFSVDLRTARVSDTRIKPAAPPAAAAVWTAWNGLLKAADLQPLTGGDAPVVGAAEVRALLSPDDAGPVLGRLVGRGPGLTPAGDDVIVGYLAGRLSVRPAPFDLLIEPYATNDISRAALDEAMRGYFGAPLLDLLRAVRAGETKAIGKALRDVVAVGATSGAAGAFGLLIGLFACRSRLTAKQIDGRILGRLDLKAGPADRVS